MPNKVLTAKTVAAARPSPDGKRREIPDGIVPGLYLVVQPSGRQSWALRFRLRGKPIKWTMGTPATLSLAKARERARRAIELVHVGEDPRPDKQAKTVTLPGTVGELCDRYIAGYLRKHTKRPEVGEGEINNHIRPRLGSMQLSQVARGHVRGMLADMEHVGPAATNQALQRLRAVFNWALQNDLADANPTLGIKRPSPQKPRDRTLSDVELSKVWRAAGSLNVPARQYFKMLILSGQRRDDVRLMHSAELDLERGDWVIPAGRYKSGRAHLVPLTEQMTEILLPLLKDRSGLLFTLADKNVAFRVQLPKIELDKASGVGEWTLHDLRRTLRTGLSRLGVRPDISERVIGHSVGGRLTATYDTHEYRAEKLAALETWGEHLGQILAGERAGNVIELEQSA